MKKLLLIAGLVYLILAPLTYHPDTKLTLYYPSLGDGRIWNIYGYLQNRELNVPPFHYPPVHYWLLKAEYGLAKLIGGRGFDHWLASGSTLAMKDERVFRFNLAAKLPLIVLTLASGWMIYKILIKRGKGEGVAFLGAVIWLFNPVTLYAVVAMGQNDILAIFPFLLGLLFYWQVPLISFLFFGVAASIKSFPLIWAIILGLAYPKSGWGKRLVLATIPTALYGLTLVPFLSNAYFRESVLGSGLMNRIFEARIDIGSGLAIQIVPVLLVICLLSAFKYRLTKSVIGVSRLLLAANLAILGFSRFHPQWFLWTMPFAAIALAMVRPKKMWLAVGWLTLMALGVITLMFNDVFLYWGIFSPIQPSLINLPFMRELVAARGIGGEQLANLAHSWMAGLAVFFLATLSKRVRLEKGFEFSWDMEIKNRLVKLLASLLIPLAATFVTVSIVNSLPAIESENLNSEKFLDYRRLSEYETYERDFQVSDPGLYRVEVQLKNPSLESRDNFEITVEKDGQKIASSTLNAYSIGDPGRARVDFVPQTDVEGNYRVRLKLTSAVDGKLEFGLREDSLEIFSYYKKGLGLKLGDSLRITAEVWRQELLAYPLAVIALWLVL